MPPLDASQSTSSTANAHAVPVVGGGFLSLEIDHEVGLGLDVLRSGLPSSVSLLQNEDGPSDGEIVKAQGSPFSKAPQADHRSVSSPLSPNLTPLHVVTPSPRQTSVSQGGSGRSPVGEINLLGSQDGSRPSSPALGTVGVNVTSSNNHCAAAECVVQEGESGETESYCLVRPTPEQTYEMSQYFHFQQDKVSVSDILGEEAHGEPPNHLRAVSSEDRIRIDKPATDMTSNGSEPALSQRDFHQLQRRRTSTDEAPRRCENEAQLVAHCVVGEGEALPNRDCREIHSPYNPTPLTLNISSQIPSTSPLLPPSSQPPSSSSSTTSSASSRLVSETEMDSLKRMASRRDSKRIPPPISTPYVLENSRFSNLVSIEPAHTPTRR